MTPSFTDNLWDVGGGGYPYLNELGVSTIWSQLSDDSSTLPYFMVVRNRSGRHAENTRILRVRQGKETDR